MAYYVKVHRLHNCEPTAIHIKIPTWEPE